MKKLLFIIAALMVAAIAPSKAMAVTSEANDFFSEMAKLISESDNYNAVWNGSDLVITTAPDPDFDGFTPSPSVEKELKKSFAEGMFSSEASPEDISYLRNIMRNNNVRIIINLMGSKSRVMRLPITYADF